MIGLHRDGGGRPPEEIGNDQAFSNGASHSGEHGWRAELRLPVLILGSEPCAAAQASAPAARAKWIRDFSGVWAAGRNGVLPGEEVSLTKIGAEAYNKIDEADSPAYRCEPHGPTRMMTSAEDIMIVQNEDTLIVVSEHINDGYRIVYINGKHPEEMAYPEWNGNSVGHWEGDTLVVDTIGMKADTWLTTSGLQHSEQMHMVERFLKTSPDTFTLKVTIDDPDIFLRNRLRMELAKLRDRQWVHIRSAALISASGRKNTPLTHGKAGPTQQPPPTFPPDVPRTYIGADKPMREPATPVVKKTKFEEDIIKTSGGASGRSLTLRVTV